MMRSVRAAWRMILRVRINRVQINKTRVSPESQSPGSKNEKQRWEETGWQRREETHPDDWSSWWKQMVYRETRGQVGGEVWNRKVNGKKSPEEQKRVREEQLQMYMAQPR